MEGYSLLKSEEDIGSRFSEDHVTQFKQLHAPKRRWAGLALFGSSILNVCFTILLFFSSHRCGPQPSSFANLVPELSLPWVHNTEYSGSNMIRARELWAAISYDRGIVALDQSWAREKGLPNSQPFPWDTSKSMYLLNGYHNLHCLKSIHLSIVEWNTGAPQTYNVAHITHCLDQLRMDIMCNADDVPRWSANDDKPESGIGQHRQCRSWAKLERWAEEHTACYRYLNASAKHLNQMERFKFCPLDSPYLPKVRKYFGVGEEWVPDTWHDQGKV